MGARASVCLYSERDEYARENHSPHRRQRRPERMFSEAALETGHRAPPRGLHRVRCIAMRGFVQVPILHVRLRIPKGRVHPVHLKSKRAAFEPLPSTLGPRLHTDLSQAAVPRSLRFVCRSQTFDIDSLRATRRRQTATHGPQRSERGPKTSDPSDLRDPCFAVKGSMLSR